MRRYKLRFFGVDIRSEEAIEKYVPALIIRRICACRTEQIS